MPTDQDRDALGDGLATWGAMAPVVPARDLSRCAPSRAQARGCALVSEPAVAEPVEAGAAAVTTPTRARRGGCRARLSFANRWVTRNFRGPSGGRVSSPLVRRARRSRELGRPR